MGTVPSPHTWTAGDDATSTVLQTLTDACNYLLGNATSGGSKKPLAVLRQTVAQGIASGAGGAAVTFDTEDVDYDSGHSTVTNTSKYVAQTQAWHVFLFKGGLGAPAASTGYGEAWLRKTPSGGAVADEPGTAAVVPSVTTGGGYHLCGGKPIFLNVGDAVELWIAQTSGASVNTTVGPAFQSVLSVYLLSV